MPRFPILAVLVFALALAGCSSGTKKAQVNVQPIRDAAAMFLTAQANQDARWVCYTSNQSYWKNQGWVSSTSAGEDDCIQGYNRWKASVGPDRIQSQTLMSLSRGAEKAKLQTAQGRSADLEFPNPNPRVCAASQMSLQRQGRAWKVSAFLQGRCMGLITKS